MEECKPILNTGLRGVTIASTKVSDVRGEEGKLIYRGYLVQDLAESASFEEVVYLLLYERLPSTAELGQLKQQLVANMPVPEGVIQAMQTFPANALPMDVMQATAAILAQYDPEIREQSRDATERMGLRLIAKLTTVLAAWERIRSGKAPVTPDPDLGMAANFLYMMTGDRPSEEVARFFDICLVLHAEHSFNASTFAAREVASTRAHIYAAISAGIGSLSGELHGGANVRVMEMLLAIGEPEKAEGYVNQVLDEGRKIMGLGHAVYKTDDPRAHILRPMSRRMGELSGETKWYEISRILEERGKAAFKARKGTDIYVNVDFYSASLYYAMGIPTDLFSPIFAISRVAGWVTHVLEEQYADAAPKPMLYRPESEYVGDYCGPDECSFVPMDDR
ncbi:MAG: citrate/2-methylcitrate synthase [Desulfosarcinaceae bacterium]|nr:citrate/2-methylcitrate synthase [Desulfosarcinaceae bacterium]